MQTDFLDATNEYMYKAKPCHMSCHYLDKFLGISIEESKVFASYLAGTDTSSIRNVRAIWTFGQHLTFNLSRPDQNRPGEPNFPLRRDLSI